MTALLQEARRLDAADSLARFRSAFALPRGTDNSGLVYLCGHSLGLAPIAAAERVREELDDWARLGVLGHTQARHPWIDYAQMLCEPLARLAGAKPAEVVAMNSLTINLHLLMASFYRPSGTRRCIVVEAGAFSSDHHAVTSQLQWHGLRAQDALIEIAPLPGADVVDEAQIEELLQERGDQIALVLWPGVQYRTGQAFDLARITTAAHRAGALCGLDLAHTIGNLPLALHDDEVDFAVWCSYKYLNAGPGALAGAFVHERHARASLPGLAGWWGHDPSTRFRMEAGFSPAPGAAGWQVSNPPIFSAAPLLASLALFDEATLPALRAKSLAVNAMLLRALDEHFAAELSCVTPREPARQGAQLSFRLRGGAASGRRVFEALARRQVIADWREPDILRLAAVPMYNRFEDVALFIDALGASLREQQ
jgi:kynureninase